MNNQGNKTLPKEGNKSLPKEQDKSKVTDPKKQIYELPDYKLKIIILKQLSQAHKNSVN